MVSLTFGVFFLTVEASLENVGARAFGSDRVIQRLDIGRNISSENWSCEQARHNQRFDNAVHFGMAINLLQFVILERGRWFDEMLS